MSSPVAAQEGGTTLSGELFVSSITTQATCDPAGQSTVNYQVTGTATGPYPGTFAESGTVTIGPQTAGSPAPLTFGQLIGFQASFVISSPEGQITGTKVLIDPPPEFSRQNSFGTCILVPGETQPSVAVLTSGL